VSRSVVAEGPYGGLLSWADRGNKRRRDRLPQPLAFRATWSPLAALPVWTTDESQGSSAPFMGVVSVVGGLRMA
jgi:hypothetical protein